MSKAMSKIVLKDENFPDCPIRNVLSRIGDKWSILVLYTLSQQDVSRFNQLQRSIPDISQKMLTSTLKTLEADGIIDRHAYPEVPPRVEYSISKRGETLLPIIQELITWASQNMKKIVRNREKAVSKA